MKSSGVLKENCRWNGSIGRSFLAPEHQGMRWVQMVGYSHCHHSNPSHGADEAINKRCAGDSHPHGLKLALTRTLW